VGIQFVAKPRSVRRRLNRYLESLERTTSPLQRPQRPYYPRLLTPVYWTAVVGVPFIRRKMPVEDLGGVRVFLDEKLKEGARLEIEVFLPDLTTVVCRVEVAWVDRLPEGSPAAFEVGLKFTAITPSDRQRISFVLGRPEAPARRAQSLASQSSPSSSGWSVSTCKTPLLPR
jgi:hypothetical protein